MFFHSIRLNRFLSFGESTEVTPLRALNLVIGPNGSGKSNLLEAFDLLRHVPQDLLRPIRQGGGIREWIWKNTTGARVAAIAVEVSDAGFHNHLQHVLALTDIGQQFQVASEYIADTITENAATEPHCYYRYESGRAEIESGDLSASIAPEHLNPAQSILAQIRDPIRYEQITHLAQSYSAIRIYRDWSFGRQSPPRRPQDTALPNEYLESDGSNLGLILNRFQREPAVKARVLAALRKLYEGIDDFGVQIEGGTVQVFLQEGDRTIPAVRLSDGTLRYLCLLAVLCHPRPPPLVCIEEPELGLHPDILPTIADLLKDASERCQLIVTTHSDVLVDCMHDQPETVLIAEKDERGTRLKRLSAADLAPWLAKYRLGELWMSGDLGGTRW